MKKTKVYTPDPVKKQVIIDKIADFIDNLQMAYNVDIRYNIDKITKK